MKIGGSPGSARTGSDETITGLWRFAHAQGLLTNDIGERSVGVGVTIENVLHLAGLVECQDLPGPNSPCFRAFVIGDAAFRYVVDTSGALGWGPGNAAIDATLFRTGVGALSFNAFVTFVNALGIATNVISERSAGLGVTIDDVRLLDRRVDIIGISAGTIDFIRARVTGDTQVRFRIRADGRMLWGTGAMVSDTELYRNAADELETPDDFNVGGALDLGGDVELSEDTTAVVASPQHDFATGTVTVRRVSTTVILTITGFAGGRAGRVIYFQKVAPLADITFTHEDVLSVAANRIRTPTGSSFTLTGAGAMWMRYDSTLSRWLIGPATN